MPDITVQVFRRCQAPLAPVLTQALVLNQGGPSSTQWWHSSWKVHWRHLFDTSSYPQFWHINSLIFLFLTKIGLKATQYMIWCQWQLYINNFYKSFHWWFGNLAMDGSCWCWMNGTNSPALLEFDHYWVLDWTPWSKMIRFYDLLGTSYAPVSKILSIKWA